MATQAATAIERPRSRPQASFFYPGMAIFAAAVILLGFSRTYYLKEFFATPPLPWLVHLHGAVMTAWMGLFIAQTALVESGRTSVHRRLGIVGGLLAAAIVVIGPAVAVYGVRAGHHPVPGANPLSFMIVPFGDIFVFGTLVGAALWYRGRPELHKRLMLVATIAILPPGVARWPLHLPRTPWIFFGIPDFILLGCIAYDCAKTGRLSPAFVVGGVLLIASHPLRLMLSGTAAWMSFAHWITGV